MAASAGDSRGLAPGYKTDGVILESPPPYRQTDTRCHRHASSDVTLLVGPKNFLDDVKPIL